MSVSAVVMVGAIVLIIAAIWFGMREVMASSIARPTAHAKVLGNCGDTMELELAIVGNRVTKVLGRTDGCGVSQQCIQAAVELARGKTLQELKAINMMNIIERTGDLPDDHLHCAQLAETTIHYALKSHKTGKVETANGLSIYKG